MFYRKPFPGRSLPLVALSLLGLGAVLPASALPPVPVLTQGYGNGRSESNRQERLLTPANVRPATFGKLFTIPLDANVNGQVLYVPDVRVHNKVQNILCVYTSNNSNHSPCSVYAFNADDGALLWHTPLPEAARFETAAPVIDLAAKTMYVVTKSIDDDGPTFLRAFDILTGAQTGIIQVQASMPGTGDGSVDGRVYYDGNHGNGTFHANERPALLLLNGVIYLASAYNTDRNPYHGWVLGYTFHDHAFHQKYVFCTTPNGSSKTTPGGGDGGIWMDGMGLSVGPKGHIYCSVGNGTFDANTGGIDYGMSYLKLSPQLKVVDYFSPYDEAAMSDRDLDTGDAGVVPLPGTDKLFAGATKFGDGFLMTSTDMGHFSSSAASGHDGVGGVVLRLKGLSSNYNIGQSPMCWQKGGQDNIYLWPRNSYIQQMVYNIQNHRFVPAAKVTVNPGTNAPYPPEVTHLSGGMTSGGAIGVSSDGSKEGILWAVGYDNVIYALDADNISSNPYWTSSMDASRDALPSTGHFQFPTIVNGKVYVPTGSASIVVYGLLPQK